MNGKKNVVRKSAKTQTADAKNISKQKDPSYILLLLLTLVVTAVCFSPMLKNGFTNWDDELYVINNVLLHGPDWKGIFSQPVVSNYHPITILSLAFNYRISELTPYSYLLVNLLLHLVNTALVFYFIRAISGNKIWVAAFTALVFGIHPMHVESVAWVSERKDVLYTFFFMWSLIHYWKFIVSEKRIHYWMCFLLFVLSLLSKPAAIILPMVLLLLDYWKGRSLNKNAVGETFNWRKLLLEKIPFFLLAIAFAVITLQIQSHKAVASLDMFPAWTRIFFACYVVMIYFIRFIVPYPLSTFHPYPSPDDLGLFVFLSPLFIVAVITFLWIQRKNKLMVFGLLFFIVNLLLVLQVVSFGNTIVSERYTYVPYIGLAFMFSMLLEKSTSRYRNSVFAVAWVTVTLIFGIVTFQRTKIWKDSGTLWTDVISHYPYAPVPHTNRGNYLFRKALTITDATEKNSLFQQVIDDCTIALKSDPKHARAYEDRGAIYLNQSRYAEALADGDSLVKIDPGNRMGYSILGSAYQRLDQPEKAMAEYSKCISLFPDHFFAYGNRGTILFKFEKYNEALADFNMAIRLSPTGQYFLNRSYCYFRLGDTAKAKEDMLTAKQLGENATAEYQNALK